MILTLLLWLLFGAVVGWVASLIMKSNLSLLMSIVLGIAGSLLGGFIASLLGFGSFGGNFSFNIVNMLISIGGACLVIFLVRALGLGRR
ncbi:MAG: GlsB/YeaQ/YmgE family stress response membrane protein [Defluviitaleaceae bacterium]|nr:GlsB/YeaQ/YmgE family stress response membrane protein [Defluviitaleaceae bacterium]